MMTVNQVVEMDVEYASGIADKATRSMSEHAVPCTPENFSVWFHYVLGSSPALKKTVDILVGNKRRFDAAINRELYATYVRRHQDVGVTSEIPEMLHGVLDHAKKYLAGAICENRAQMDILDGVAANAPTVSDPRLIIEQLVIELSKATNRASSLESCFLQTSEELDKIRDTLKAEELRSNTDVLTGIANRRAFEEFFRTAQIAAMEGGEPLSIFMIDIDHFKTFNDRYGHLVGDQVLRLVAKILKEGLREGDLAARFGGEELIAVLPGADLASCAAVAERIRLRLSNAQLTRRSSGLQIASVTISVGVSQFRFGESAETIISRCDRALYQAKRSGRNTVIVEDAIDDEVAA